MVMNNAEKNGGASASLMFAFCGGALVGTAAGLLLAPKTGRESRAQLKGYLQKTKDRVQNLAQHSAATIEKTAEAAASENRTGC